MKHISVSQQIFGYVNKTLKQKMCVCDPVGSGSLRAKFELSDGPSTPSTQAVQIMSEGSALSEHGKEVVGSGYPVSLDKSVVATGICERTV